MYHPFSFLNGYNLFSFLKARIFCNYFKIIFFVTLRFRFFKKSCFLFSFLKEDFFCNQKI